MAFLVSQSGTVSAIKMQGQRKWEKGHLTCLQRFFPEKSWLRKKMNASKRLMWPGKSEGMQRCMKPVASNELSCPRKKSSPFYCLKILMNAALRQALKTWPHTAQELEIADEISMGPKTAKTEIDLKSQLICTVYFLCWQRLWCHKQDGLLKS